MNAAFMSYEGSTGLVPGVTATTDVILQTTGHRPRARMPGIRHAGKATTPTLKIIRSSEVLSGQASHARAVPIGSVRWRMIHGDAAGGPGSGSRGGRPAHTRVGVQCVRDADRIPLGPQPADTV